MPEELAFWNYNEYRVINNITYQRVIFTPRFSTVPAEVINTSNKLINLEFVRDKYFKIHPNIKYAEKILINPKYINLNNTLKMTLYKNNKGLQLEEVTLRGSNANKSLSKITGTADINVNELTEITNKINPEFLYRMEAGTNKLITISGIDRNCDIIDDAIKTTSIFCIPNEGRLQLALEFT